MFTKQWLEALISGLPLLERFSLVHSHELEKISICSHSLKSLYIHVTPSFEVVLATPNLVWLDLSCVAKSVISVVAPDLFEAKLRLWHNNSTKASYDDLVRFLSNFNGLKKMMLSVWWKQVLLITLSSFFFFFFLHLYNVLGPLLLWLTFFVGYDFRKI